jgi:pilus assembly protein CpaB
MKSKTLILMFVAIVCGLAASYMTSRVIAERSQTVEEEKVTVLVARQNIPLGVLISEPEKLFEERQFTKGTEPKKGITSFDVLKDKRLSKPLGAEQFVTVDDLLDKANAGLQAVMKPGMRAVALKVNAEGNVGGFVLPHSRVDIVSVVRRNENESVAKVILQNVLVLAVDQSPTRPDDKPAMLASTVTVEVTPNQAEKLSMASELGPIRLILRSFGDDEKVTTTGSTAKSLLQSGDKAENTVVNMDSENARPKSPIFKVPDVPPQKPVVEVVKVKPPEPPPPPKTHTLTIYNGESVTKAVFVEGENDTRIEKSQPSSTPANKPAQRPSPAKP